MKTPIWVYIVLVVISGAAGLAIAGIPDTSPREPTIIPPATTEVSDPLERLEEVASTTTVAPETTVASTTTLAPDTTTTTTTTTTTVPEPPARDEVEVAVANGAGIGGVAGDTAEFLAGLGYTNTRLTDGLDIDAQTFIYAAESLTSFAQRLSDEMGLPGGRVRDLFFAPETAPAVNSEVIVYVGADIQLIIG